MLEFGTVLTLDLYGPLHDGSNLTDERSRAELELGCRIFGSPSPCSDGDFSIELQISLGEKSHALHSGRCDRISTSSPRGYRDQRQVDVRTSKSALN